MNDNELSKEINVKMFYKIADVIETYPEKHDQETWFENFGHANGSINLRDNIIYDGVRYSCDTNQCIAGWAVILDGNKVSFNGADLLINGEVHHDFELIEKAADILGIDNDSARTLFYTMDMDNFDWPSILRMIGDGNSVSDTLDHFHNLYWSPDDEDDEDDE